MYKVLDKETKEKIVVSAIDTAKHLHISGVEFTAETLVGLETVSKKAPKVEEIVEDEVVVETPKAKKGK